MRFQPDLVTIVDDLRLDILLRMLKSPHFSAKMNSLKEVSLYPFLRLDSDVVSNIKEVGERIVSLDRDNSGTVCELSVSKVICVFSRFTP